MLRTYRVNAADDDAPTEIIAMNAECAIAKAEEMFGGRVISVRGTDGRDVYGESL